MRLPPLAHKRKKEQSVGTLSSEVSIFELGLGPKILQICHTLFMERYLMTEHVKDTTPDLSPDLSKAEADLAAIDNGQPIKGFLEISGALSEIVSCFRELGLEKRAIELERDRMACLLVIRLSITGSIPEKLTPAERITGIATFSDGSVRKMGYGTY